VIDPRKNMAIDRRKCRRIMDFLIIPENAALSNHEVGRRLGVAESYVRRTKAAFPYGATTLLAIDAIRMDGSTQPRAELKSTTIVDYADAMRSGDMFPPVTVFHDGSSHWLADGFHRVRAAILAGWEEIEAEVRMGDRRDAVLFSVGANATHGERRTTADKRRAVEKLLRDEEWSRWSDREIGRRCWVDGKTIAAIRRELSAEIPQIETSRTVERKGTIYTQDISKIGARPSTNGNGAVPASVSSRDPSSPDFDEPRNVQADDVQADDVPPDAESEASAAPSPVATRARRRPRPRVDRDAGEWEETPGRDEPETPATPPTDDEYLGSLPARSKLPETVLDRFDAEALLYRDLTELRERYTVETRVLVKRAVKASKGHHGPLISLHYRYLALNDPGRWTACEPCEGSGKDDLLGKCPACRGHGYHA
jgi:hypothetical protein